VGFSWDVDRLRANAFAMASFLVSTVISSIWRGAGLRVEIEVPKEADLITIQILDT